MSDDDSNQ